MHTFESSLVHSFHWFQSTGIGSYGRKSSYFFPITEIIHLRGLTLLLGSVLLTNLRVLGFIMTRYDVPNIVRAARPLLWVGLGTALTSGVLMFLTEAVKCYYNIAFWYKMSLLAAAIVFQLIAQRRLLADSLSRGSGRGIAIVSLLLWFGVGIAGRAIAFV